MNIPKLMQVASALFLLAAMLPGADRPDTAGTWKLNQAKSDLGEGAPALDLTIKTRTQGEDYLVTQDLNGDVSELRFRFDGKETVNEIGAVKITCVHKWEGETLLGDCKVEGDWGAVTQKDRITYSADGKTMTMLREIRGADERNQKFVFEKQ